MIETLVNTPSSTVSVTLALLTKAREAVKVSPRMYLRELDNFANAIFKYKSELKAFIEVLTNPRLIDEFWTFLRPTRRKVN